MMSQYVAKNVPDALSQIAKVLSSQRADGQRAVCYLPGNAGRIDCVENWIFDNAEQLAQVDIFQVMALGPAEGWARAVLGGVGVVTPFIGPGVRELVNTGLARNIRCNLSQVPSLFKGRWKPDVAFAHTSTPDHFGFVTLGLNAGIDFAPVSAARYKVAVINKRVPRWYNGVYYDPPTERRIPVGCAMHIKQFDMVIEIDEPLLEYTMHSRQKKSEGNSDAIAEHILNFLSKESGASSDLPHTIQLGIGALPDSFANALSSKQVSVHGVWSELFSDGVLGLYHQGLIQKTSGIFLRDHIVVGFVLGTNALYEEMRENSDFAILPQEIVNDPAMIRHNKHMVSINAAIAVSLTGEIASATINKKYHSDVGGQFDFALGASWSEHGVAIIALSSILERRDHSLESKIVATHGGGAHHTIGSDLPVVVVTEHGVADLRFQHDNERAEAMLRIAHPDWRALLTKEARRLPSMQGIGTIPARLISLTDGRTALLRTITKDDIGALQSYITQLSREDLHSRYMGTVSVSSLTSADRMTRIYHDTLDYFKHAAFILELKGEIIGVAHAFETKHPGTYEISFSRRSDFYGQGIGRNLMRMLIDWGVLTGAEYLEAITYRTENPRMRKLFDRFSFHASPDPDDNAVVNYRASLAELTLARNLVDTN